ncbi:MAG: hypothetical protein ABJB12_04895 [Pseudomonadota bacterium]
MSVSRGINSRIKNAWAGLAEPGALRVLSHAVALAPRLIVHIASIAVIAGLVSACVPATRYEEAKSAGEVELAGRQRAEAELRAAQEQLAQATAQLNQREQKLSETEQSVSESKFENSVAVKERDEATGMVDQLRGELARVGDNLRSYAKQKAELEKSLDAAQQRKAELEKNEAHTVAIARLTRDLTSALGDRVTSGDVSIDVQGGRVVISAPTELWFDDGGALRGGIDGVLAAISRVLTLHTDSALELRVPGPDADKRSAVLVSALGARGVAASRIGVPPTPVAPAIGAAPESAPAARPPELSKPGSVELSFSVS